MVGASSGAGSGARAGQSIPMAALIKSPIRCRPANRSTHTKSAHDISDRLVIQRMGECMVEHTLKARNVICKTAVPVNSYGLFWLSKFAALRLQRICLNVFQPES